MYEIEKLIGDRYNNFLFIGEAGSGKSEIAVNIARLLLKAGSKPVHFFDMDMTKPLFRSRDLCEQLSSLGIQFHFEKQFMDAPTLAGGLNRLLHILFHPIPIRARRNPIFQASRGHGWQPQRVYDYRCPGRWILCVKNESER